MKKQEKDIFEFITIQPFDIYILFCYLDSEDAIIKNLNKKNNKEISTWLHKHIGNNSINTMESVGCVFKKDDNRPLIFFLKKHKNKRELVETVVHETNHLLMCLNTYFCFSKEWEFNAYLQQYLLGLILDKLNVKIH